jgi:hypothetical protein
MVRLSFIISVILLFQAIGLGQQSENATSVPPPPLKTGHPDWFHEIKLRSWNDEKLRISLYAKELANQKDSKLYIIIEAKNPKSTKILNRRKGIENFLTNIQKVKRGKFQLVITKSDIERIQYWLVPKGAIPPTN